jgi:hypothetical protein
MPENFSLGALRQIRRSAIEALDAYGNQKATLWQEYGEDAAKLRESLIHVKNHVDAML